MAKTKVVRMDPIHYGGMVGERVLPLHIGSSGNDRPGYETVDEFLVDEFGPDAFGEVNPYLTRSAKEVTRVIAPVVERVGSKWQYGPEGDVRYIEVTTKQVFAVYRGTLRPEFTERKGAMPDLPDPFAG